ncbi:Smr/MutS family protein [Aurantibacter crassamenti]|uniref:Smr/MutS family protein n=1 Tax=Aurantibacter crassamenti TaxID=1837375 RepID=UPI001939E85A|nr:Smr/MutS family protein [Aurantibacter crassamenti]MBM1106660.1 Smr/MutS family protein [Aurantibacter crassamenti]
MSVFQLGDKVEVLDDTICGVVISIDENEITIESDEGFELSFSAKELVKVATGDTMRISSSDISKAKAEKEQAKKRKFQTINKKERNAPKMEVDLHINQLVKSSKSMTNYEMLNIQLDTAKRQLEFAIRNRIQKVVFIHGVGEGVLKEELNTLFRRYENLKYYDAEYKKYGTGATEVYLFQNV